MKVLKRWNGKERMLQAVLHPAVWIALRARGRAWKDRYYNRVRLRRKHIPEFQPLDTQVCESVSEDYDVGRSVVSLNPDVWKNLPQELIEKVLGKLPYRSFLAFRSVCKRWNSYILAAGLASACICPSRTALVHFTRSGEFRHQPLSIYNPKMDSWDKEDLAFLCDGGISGPHSLVAANGGLLCFCDSSWEVFLVCNPLSKQWRVLRPPTRVLPQAPGVQVVGSPGDFVLVGLVVTGASYKLVLAGMCPRTMRSRGKKLHLAENVGAKSERATFVYDSLSGTWTDGPLLPLSPPLLENGVWCNEPSRKSVSCNGKLYWYILEQSNEEWDHPYRELVRLDIENSEWSKAYVDDHELQDLVSLEGKVLVMKLRDGVRLTFSHNPGVGLRGFYSSIDCVVSPGEWDSDIWEIQDAGDEMWLTKKKMPKALGELKRRDRVTSDYGHKYFCVGQDSSLFIMHQVIDGDFDDEWEMKGWRVLHYDSSKRSCNWLPQLTTELEEQCPFSWWTFRPSLTAVP